MNKTLRLHNFNKPNIKTYIMKINCNCNVYMSMHKHTHKHIDKYLNLCEKMIKDSLYSHLIVLSSIGLRSNLVLLLCVHLVAACY